MKIRNSILGIIALVTLCVIGCKKDPLFDTTEITTKQVTSITGSSAVSGGEITSDGFPTISQRGVCYGTSHEPTMNDRTAIHPNGGLGSFSVTMTDLLENTTYYVRAFAWNSTGAIYGEEYSFTTPYKPVLSTLEVENVTSVSAICGGDITDDGNAKVSQRGLCWSIHENPTLDDSTTVVDSVGIGTFKSEMTKLTPGTLYYVRAYATNAAGTSYGEELSFTTQNVPVLKATECTEVTQETVLCHGDIISNAGAEVTEQGFCWGTTSQPTIENEKITAVAENGLGNFSITISGLQWGTTYYVRSYATNSVGTAYGDETSFTTWTLPEVSTNSVTNITDKTVDCGGTITFDGGTPITEKGLCWSTSANPTVENNKLQIAEGENIFSGTITELTDGVTYYVRAYATNIVGTTYGNERIFTTLTLPTIEINAQTVSYTTATIQGKVVSDGGATVIERGFCYSTSNENPTLNDSKKIVGNGTGSFTSDFNGLNDGIKYYIRSYATNSVGTAYGEVMTFTTIPITAPIVATSAASNVSYTTVTLGGDVTAENGASVTERGVCWSTSVNPTISNSKKTVGSGTGTFTADLTGLNDGVTYYVRAYATNERGTAYGEEKTFTTTKITAPTVTTTAASNISYTTVTLGGNVTAENGASVTERGVCWSTSSNPTISNGKKAVGSGTGSFSANITGLSDGVTYYVRAYATNSKGTSYGEEKSFTTTKITIPTVTTATANNISFTKATLGGNVTKSNGATVTERGVCWSTSANPTISNSKQTIGSGTGSFSANITGLEVGVTYYVRAYAINSKGTAYGNQITFKITNDGVIMHAFSVSTTQKVYFSQGNLQYQASTGTWRFATHQYDMIGSANKNISSTYSGWIDLFGWGTSGYNNKFPYMTSVTDTDYGDGVKNIAGTNYDWGVYNKISNGGNTSGMWRTLTRAEWSYLMETRTDATQKRGKATINNICGLVLLPDEWSTPAGVSFNASLSDFSNNKYSTSDWSKMEKNGAIFLPAAGERHGETLRVDYVNSYCSYWSSSVYQDYRAYYLTQTAKLLYSTRGRGRSVRLVRNIE